MDGLLTEVETVKKVQNNIDKFETLSLHEKTKPRSNSTKSKRSIVDITSSSSSEGPSGPFDLQASTRSSETFVDSKPAVKKHKRQDSTAFLQRAYLEKPRPSLSSLPNDAREILRYQPDQEDLTAVLQYLQYGIEGKHDFNVHQLGPQAAQIINVIVTITVPDQWHLLRQPDISKTGLEIKRLITSILRGVAGIGALLLQIRSLAVKKANLLMLDDALSVLNAVVSSSQTVRLFLKDATTLYARESQRRVYWQETISIFCGSKILSTASQALATNNDVNLKDLRWLGDGTDYSIWLARNISACAASLPGDQSEAWTMLSQLLKRAMSLGYRDSLISGLYSSLLLGSHAMWTPLRQLLGRLSDHEQRAFFDALLLDLVRKYLRHESPKFQHDRNELRNQNAIGGVAAMVAGLIHDNSVLEEHIERWLTSNTGEYASVGLDTRRAVIATLGLRQDKLQKIIDKCVETFGDKLQIQHSPIFQQESTTEIILLSIGYLYRRDPEAVKKLSKMGLFLRCVSNRLSASVPRARVLGMVVAVAVSRLVDPADKVMNFDSEEMESDQTQKMLDLVNVCDRIATIEDLGDMHNAEDVRVIEEPSEAARLYRKAPTRKKERPTQSSKIIAIEEVDDEEDEEEDLIPYAKPDEDPSDSDEDPTLINRSKPSEPVYIVDLIKQLQTNDKPEIIEVALRTAPDLIRRKANFGTELSDNVQAVASSILNLKDGMSNPDLQHSRLRSLIACLFSKPAAIGPWLASMYFEGDFSLAQRATILTTIGLSSRELSGHQDSCISVDAVPFPSKQLLPHLAAIYSPTNSIAGEIEHSTLQPLALAAADKLSGPDILKVRTFSSRLEVERKKEAKQEERSRRIPKDLHAVLAESLYLPLCCRMSLLLISNVNTTRSVIFEANIVRLFLQTLTIILHCLGPNAIQLATVTRETLLLLVALHNSPTLAYDAVVLPALLQLLLTTLDLNVEAGRTAEERLVTEFGGMMAELITWAGGLADGGINVPVLEGEGMGMGMPWTVLVAGIQVKWHEVGRKFQGRMLVLMGGELDSF